MQPNRRRLGMNLGERIAGEVVMQTLAGLSRGGERAGAQVEESGLPCLPFLFGPGKTWCRRTIPSSTAGSWSSELQGCSPCWWTPGLGDTIARHF